MLNELRRFEKEYGRPPVERDFINNHEYPGFVVYQRRFGSWINSLKLAGLDTDFESRKHKQQYTEEELLDYLRWFEKEYERPPTEKDFTNNPEYPGYATYQRRFGSWINALIKAGLYVNLAERQCDSFIGRQAEIVILDHLENKAIDLSGENRWKVPGDMAEKDYFLVGLNSNWEFNIENMKEYDITEKFKKYIDKSLTYK